MSYPIFPTNVPFNRKAGFKKTPHFNVITQKPAAFRGVVTASLVPFPTWDFEVTLEYAIGDESTALSILASFLDVYIQCHGSGVFFLFTDPNDNNVAQGNSAMFNVTPGAAAPMGVQGDGVSTQYQLGRSIGPTGLAYDLIQNTGPTSPQVYVNGELIDSSLYSISSTGVITFVTAPDNLATLQWSGPFYFLCQFSNDTLKDLMRVGFIPSETGPNGFDGLWQCGNIQFSSIFV